MKIIYTENNTKIIDTYLLKDNEIPSVVYGIRMMRNRKRLLMTRTTTSYIREIKAHNRLYKLGLFRSHTKDTDLEENQSKFKELIYTILSI